jgi:hypothetical protein
MQELTFFWRHSAFFVVFLITSSMHPGSAEHVAVSFSGLSDRFSLCKTAGAELTSKLYKQVFNVSLTSGFFRGMAPLTFDKVEFEAVPGSVRLKPHFSYTVRKPALYCFLMCSPFAAEDRTEPIFKLTQSIPLRRNDTRRTSPTHVTLETSSVFDVEAQFDYENGMAVGSKCKYLNRGIVAEWWLYQGSIYGDDKWTASFLVGASSVDDDAMVAKFTLPQK